MHGAIMIAGMELSVISRSAAAACRRPSRDRATMTSNGKEHYYRPTVITAAPRSLTVAQAAADEASGYMAWPIDGDASTKRERYMRLLRLTKL